MQRYLLLAVLTPLLAGCYLFESNTGAPPTEKVAYYESSCGPAGGSALTIHLTDEPTSCERLHEIDYNAPELAHVRLVLYGLAEPDSGYTQQVGTLYANPLPDGWGRRCPGDGAACIEIRSGRVTFGATDEGNAALDVELEFEDGERIEGSYRLEQCEVPVVPCI